MTLQSHKALIDSKEARESCARKILNLLEVEPLRTDELILKLPKYAKSTVTGRISDLNDEGLITPTTECGYKGRNTLYRLTYSMEKEKVILARKKERFRQWLNQSVEFQDWMPSEVMRWIQLEERI